MDAHGQWTFDNNPDQHYAEEIKQYLVEARQQFGHEKYLLNAIEWYEYFMRDEGQLDDEEE